MINTGEEQTHALGNLIARLVPSSICAFKGYVEMITIMASETRQLYNQAQYKHKLNCKHRGQSEFTSKETMLNSANLINKEH